MIRVNACQGCNQDAKLLSNGHHAMPSGEYLLCRHIRDALESIADNDWRTDFKWAAYSARIGAKRRAAREYASLLHIGSGPYEIWLAIKEMA